MIIFHDSVCEMCESFLPHPRDQTWNLKLPSPKRRNIGPNHQFLGQVMVYITSVTLPRPPHPYTVSDFQVGFCVQFLLDLDGSGYISSGFQLSHCQADKRRLEQFPVTYVGS